MGDMKMITKRDGREEPFNFYKIIDAAKGAYADVGLEMPPELQAEIINTDWPNKIEDIQDELYKHIYKYSRKVAKAFKTYRSARTRARDMNTNGKYYDTVLRVVQGDKTSDVYRENANKDASKLNTMRDLIAGETCKKLYRELVLDPEIMELHDKNIIHIHDMDYRLMKGITNCCLANLQDMLLNGTVMNGKLIRSPHTLRVAATVATQIITAIVGVQYGGITITISALSPFVRRSKEKYEKFVSQYDLPEDIKRRMVEDMLKKEVTDSIQTFQYQLNSMMSTNGRQLAA